MDYPVPLSDLYAVVWVLPVPAGVLAEIISAVEELKQVKLSRCIHPVLDDAKTEQERCVWAFTASGEIQALVLDVLGLRPNPHPVSRR